MISLRINMTTEPTDSGFCKLYGLKPFDFLKCTCEI